MYLLSDSARSWWKGWLPVLRTKSRMRTFLSAWARPSASTPSPSSLNSTLPEAPLLEPSDQSTPSSRIFLMIFCCSLFCTSRSRARPSSSMVEPLGLSIFSRYSLARRISKSSLNSGSSSGGSSPSSCFSSSYTKRTTSEGLSLAVECFFRWAGMSSSRKLSRRAKARTPSLSRMTGISWMSGVTPTSWMETSPGIRYSATVSLRQAPWTEGGTRSLRICTVPFPKVCSPIRMARSRFLSAPARISEAEALPELTSTTRGISRSEPSSLARCSSRIFWTRCSGVLSSP